MKKILLLILACTVVLSMASCTVRTEKYEDEEGNVKEFTYVTRETSDKFLLFEEALLENDIAFSVEEKVDGIINGAKKGKKYIFEDGRVFEIYLYDIKSDAYKELAKTSRMYMEMFDVYIDVVVNAEYALLPGNDAEISTLFGELK